MEIGLNKPKQASANCVVVNYPLQATIDDLVTENYQPLSFGFSVRCIKD